MNAQQQRVLESFRRVQGWFTSNQQHVTEGSPASVPALAAQVHALAAIVDRIMDAVAEQQTQLTASMLISKDEREYRREVLTHHMAPIARVARTLRGSAPGIGVLTMPRGNILTAALVTEATVMARKAEVYAPVLIEQGLPTDFLQQLHAAARKLKDSLDARGLARGARAAASRGLEAELALGRRVVTVMDVTLDRVLRSQPSKLAEWKHVKRVVVRGFMPRQTATADAVPPTAAEVSPTRIVASPTRPEPAPTRPEEAPIPPDATPSPVEVTPIVRERAA